MVRTGKVLGALLLVLFLVHNNTEFFDPVSFIFVLVFIVFSFLVVAYIMSFEEED